MYDGHLKIKIFADGADIKGIKEMNEISYISGFTTNPTLMRKVGVKDYKAFAKEILGFIKDKPISFEVFSDDDINMIKQGMEIASWGKNVNVKIPITNSKGEFTGNVIKELSNSNVIVNVTAIMTESQVRKVVENLNVNTDSIVSVFAGRVADTGIDPINIMKNSLEIMKDHKKAELIWASPRELLNIFQANDIGCHIITATNDILAKLNNVGKDLEEFSLETVKMFREDALAANFKI
jgi:transaldolase